MQIQEEQKNKLDRNKIYFLVIVITALLGTNAYLFFKDKKQSEKFITVSTEKDKLELEVEKIEVELDKVSALNDQLNGKLANEQRIAREKIAEVKLLLQQEKLTQGDLEKAQKEIKELREFVRNYNSQITQLEKENSFLKTERDSLEKSVNNERIRTSELEQKNVELNSKVKVGAALKASNVQIIAYKIKSNGKLVEVNKASTTNKLSIRFGITPNTLASKDYHRIYVRVFDPAGNLIAKTEDLFEAEGQELQYSQAITISYNNDDTAYTIDWINPKTYIKGTYAVILYADGYIMGKTQIDLK